MDPVKLEKENITGKNLEGNNANTPLRVLTASSIIGERVENLKGENIGKVKDIMLDISSGKIEYVVIQFGGFLGIGEKLFAIPFQAFQLNTEEKVFILDEEKEFLENAPGFDKDHWPETNNHYVAVNTYWGDFMGPNTGGGF
jgi:sporulation protein YlmC with PRC-barrel domain